MLLRMGLIALLVVSLSALDTSSRLLARSNGRDNRDVVLIFDGSYSMGYTGTGQTAQDTAREWALGYVDQLLAGDTVAVLHAKQQVITHLDATHDLDAVRGAIQQ